MAEKILDYSPLTIDKGKTDAVDPFLGSQASFVDYFQSLIHYFGIFQSRLIVSQKEQKLLSG